ncbi:lauroyl-Kdo(2)-lipid IV(A) myristoyltransferase [Actinobacillus suis]|uniref:Lipid A biosynthesis acyltransferase n=2 Tax=Actinobacillus suis TaxID=716 RepID=K0G6M4_ACTSU|nr:lauroyl-Kdo(2)-lipid IV(A) myristoyltransferase [Actinobacillus suis]AFU19384.1 lipid A biosynthesis (KDO)2-(lauroyl)-lipid IVA acyltransferase [Actinobacillus suis H91-0380]AIJ31522.1 lipid A biosynthesis (KDO)2-(lauroyl)-lipid IVA acyltransferase [Actinobacillus suis ATCC 33415]MCO4166496.1 lauroyl-Kdo(2)-lipid IV(A) myristoyltransferase [Actinobacillus suis]MCO4168612.1 lauroyl-Kdo(2)-lipid IV(A) myristoyltransferase [Actinobacillus suis]MCQ9630352.1 lauroyl-Kdo(2)-lipid IV(A) myristoylt
MTERITARDGYEHKFLTEFLYPKYWGVWLGVFALVVLAYIPPCVRDKLGAWIGRVVANYLKRKGKKQYHRANVNLRYCFPEWSEQKRAEVIEKMFVTVSQTMLAIGETALRSTAYLQKRCEFNGFEYVRDARAKGKNVILLVPHTWSIDAAGVAMYTHGFPMTSMYNPHRNALVDWLWNITRERFGGKMHTRQNGIKKFLNDVRKGDVGYFLPDEDYGEELSVYADFFATEKATLPGLNKMAKVANAVVIPMFPIYNAEKGVYQMEILPALEFSGDPVQSAREMNKVIEYFVTKNPEQYVWILRLLKTRRNGEDIYKR